MKNQYQTQTKELVRSDTNIEKWAVFTTRQHVGERSLVNQDGTQKVEIGLTIRGGRQYSLTAGDGKVWYSLLKKWEDDGRPTNKPIIFTIRSLCKELGIKNHTGSIKRIKNHLSNLFDIPITYIESYQSPEHIDTITTKLHLLGHLKIFERRKKTDGSIEKYFGFSEFKIHETIMDTILKKGINPIRLDVIKSLKSDCAFILYRYLDSILFHAPKHEHDLLGIAQICGLEDGQPLKKIKETITRALKELNGKELSSGRVNSAEIVKSKEKSGWKIVVTKGKQIEALTSSKIKVEKNSESDDFQNYFNSLSTEEQGSIKQEAKNRSEQSSFFKKLGEEASYEWLEGEIQAILSERMASGELVKTNKNRVGGTRMKKVGGGMIVEKDTITVSVIYNNPDAKEVKVAGEWNEWNPKVMNRVDVGLWRKELNLKTGVYKYKLVVDGVWMSNPGKEVAGDEMGNSLLRV